jgi:fusicocca-2,10(14)-diene synthase/ophiobolin F synthase
MEYKYSTVIDSAMDETEGLCDGIDLRQHNYTYLEDRGAIRAHEDWAKYIGPVTGYRGTLGPRYSFMSVSVPECIPERLEIISYANEFAFLHDGESLSLSDNSYIDLSTDVTENVNQDKASILSHPLN